MQRKRIVRLVVVPVGCSATIVLSMFLIPGWYGWIIPGIWLAWILWGLYDTAPGRCQYCGRWNAAGVPRHGVSGIRYWLLMSPPRTDQDFVCSDDVLVHLEMMITQPPDQRL